MSEELVVDASAMVNALMRDDAAGVDVARRIARAVCHAPHLIDAEVGSVLRKAERGGLMSADNCVAGLRMARMLVDERYVHYGWLAADSWRLRHTVSFCDGLYVALAARLGVPLLTADVRLTKAAGLPCAVELAA